MHERFDVLLRNICVSIWRLLQEEGEHTDDSGEISDDKDEGEIVEVSLPLRHPSKYIINYSVLPRFSKGQGAI